MVHGQRRRTRCNTHDHCCFGFPFALRDSTTVNEDGRVLYRRDTPEDAWVVSYMPALTKLMECHVNEMSALLLIYSCTYTNISLKSPRSCPSIQASSPSTS